MITRENMNNLLKMFNKRSQNFKIVAGIQFQSIIDTKFESISPQNKSKFIKLLNGIFLENVRENTQNVDMNKFLLIAFGYIAYHVCIFEDESFEKFWFALQSDNYSNTIPVVELRKEFLKIPDLILNRKSKSKKEFDLNEKSELQKYRDLSRAMPNEFYDALRIAVGSILTKMSNKQMPSNSNKNNKLQFDNGNVKFINISENDCLMSDVNGVNDFDDVLNTLTDEQFKILIANVAHINSATNTHKTQNVSMKELKESIKYKNEVKDQLNDSANELLQYFVHKLNSVEDEVNKLRADQRRLGTANERRNVSPNTKSSTKNVMSKMSKSDVVYVWEIKDFNSLKFGPIKMRESDHFYTSECGYKMCLRIYANGNGDGCGTHLSVFYALMKGDYDDKLRWPFSGVVTLTLLDKSDYKSKKHFYKRFSKCEFPDCYKRPWEDYNEAYGDRTFCPLKDLSPESRYLSNGSIFVKLSIEMK